MTPVAQSVLGWEPGVLVAFLGTDTTSQAIEMGFHSSIFFSHVGN